MSQAAPHVLQALRLPELYRLICRHAGLPLSSDAGPASDRFILRSGKEPPELFAALLEDAFLDDEAEVPVWPADQKPDYHALPPGGIAVQPGFSSPCPNAAGLQQAACPTGGSALLFAVERRDDAGGLLAVTWAAVPEEEPPPQAEFRGAVLSLAGPAADQPLMEQE